MRRPRFEWLEDRCLLTTLSYYDFIVPNAPSVRLVPSNGFQADSNNPGGTLYAATGGTVQIGLTPSTDPSTNQPEPFLPLLTVTLNEEDLIHSAGTVKFVSTAADPTFGIVNGSLGADVAGANGVSVDETIWQSPDGSGLTSFDVRQMVSANGYTIPAPPEGGSPAIPVSIPVAGVQFQVSTLQLTNSPDGNTAQSQLELQGNLTIPALPNLNLLVQGGNYVHVTTQGVTLDGVEAEVKVNDWEFAGLQLTADLEVGYSSAGDTFTFGGKGTLSSIASADSTKRVDGLGIDANIEVAGGELTKFSGGVTGNFNVGPLKVSSDPSNHLQVSYSKDQDDFELTGSLSVTYKQDETIGVTLGYTNNPNDPGVIIQDGAL
jgi:hypothetical protein